MKTRLMRCVTLLSIFVAPALFAQTTGQITGTVTDNTGAVVNGAAVTVRETAKGVERTTTSNSSGEYLVPGLGAGVYDVSVTAPGFKTFQAKGVKLDVGEKSRVDVPLTVGATNTEVVVSGEAITQVETQQSDLAGTVTGKEITQLELNGRNFSQLATLVPGVSNQSGQDEAGVGVGGNVSFSVNGGRTEYNNWELDGGDNMDNGSNTTLNVYPSLEAIAEFKVLTSNYGAQYGRNASGTVEVETKSGTSSFHGNAYEFVRNDAFNAVTFPQTTVPPYKKNDFGYTIGGPVFIPKLYNTSKQKTFFFWSQEWRRDRVPNNFGTTIVPSVAERSGNFSDLCPNPTTGSFADCPRDPATGNFFPSNTVPIDQNNAVPLLPMIPEPNGGVPGAETWSASPTLPTTWREELVRVDHNFNSKIRGTFRYIHDSWEQTYPTPLWTNGTSFPTIQTDFKGPGLSLVTRLTASASPTLLNEFVFSYTTDHITLNPVGAYKRPTNMTWGIFPGVFGGKLPGISLVGGVYNFGEDVGYLPGPYNSNPTYTYRDNVTKIVGKHNLQFGAYFVAAQKNELAQPSIAPNGSLTFDASNSSPASDGNPTSTGNAFADLLSGRISSFTQTSAQPKFYNRYKILEPYFQDDWHITPRLTLNLGLRVSLFGTYRERYHREFNFDPSHFVAGASGVDPATGLVIGDPFNGVVQCGVTSSVPDSCMKGHLFNPAPRIGFAWDPTGSGKTAIRGGYGVFFEHTNGNEANAESLEPAASPVVQTTTVNNIVGYTTIGPQPPGSSTPLAMISIPNKAVWPYVQQWHFDVQRDIYRNTIATVSYVGSKGTHLTRARDINQVFPTPLSQNPYAPGEPIGPNDCNTFTTPSGVPVTAQAAINLQIACGANPDPFRTNFPGIGGVLRLEEAASSVYHGLEVSVRRSVGALQLSASYTLSHSIDDSSSARDPRYVNSYDLLSARASSNFDQRHLFNLGYVYDLPFFRRPGLTNKLLGGWQWSGITTIQSGTPFSVSNGVISDNAGVANTFATNGATSYPDLVSDPNSGIQNFPFEGFGPLFFNPSAFAAPRGLTFGNVPRNFLRNPRRTNFDMALFKHFAIRESMAFEFRAEAFNVFNHLEYAWLGGDSGSAASNSPNGNPNNTITCYGANNSAGDPNCTSSNGYLRPAVAHNARILQLGLKFIF
jgi:Carboxypeptidase regulatory-like domain/TonB-dependent Receptor Plug Domain